MTRLHGSDLRLFEFRHPAAHTTHDAAYRSNPALQQCLVLTANKSSLGPVTRVPT